ncbi:MAG: hypothetical protein ABFR95_09245 [Actinomycetota bacterium]
MTRTQRILLMALTAVLVFVVAAPAFASGDDGAVVTDTTVATEPVFSDGAPAVVVPPAEDDPVEQPWTARFLIPLFVVTALVLVVGVAIAYNRNVRTRYKVTA